MKLLLVVIGFALVGCGGATKQAPVVRNTTPPPPAPPPVSCDTVINGVIDHMMHEEMTSMSPDERQQAEAMIDRMVPRMKAAVIASCTQDKWPADILVCMRDAKGNDELERCNQKLTADQRAHVEKAVSEAMANGDGDGDHDDAMGAPPPPPPPPPPAAPAATVAGLPQECVAYKAALDKLATCDKLPQESRDAMQQAYATASQGWATLTPDQMVNLAPACKAATDAIEQSAKSLCGW